MRVRTAFTEEQVERVIGTLLRSGVLIAAAVVLAGGICHLRHSGPEPVDYHVFHSEPPDLRSVSGITRLTVQFHCEGLIQFGLLLLIATPIARVAFSVGAFALEGDWTYVVITLI